MKLYFYNSDINNTLGSCQNIFDILNFFEQNPMCDTVNVQMSKSGTVFQLSSNYHNCNDRSWIYRTKDNKLICANTDTTVTTLDIPYMIKNISSFCYPIHVQPLLDGSLLRLYYNNGKWRLATNGCMDAYESFYNDVVSFGEKFTSVLSSLHFSGVNYDKLNPNCTYMLVLTDDCIYYVGHIHVLYGGSIRFYPCKEKIGLPMIRTNGRPTFSKRLPTFVARTPRDLKRRLSSIRQNHLGVSLFFNNHPYAQVFCKTSSAVVTEFERMKTNCNREVLFIQCIKNKDYEALKQMSTYLSEMMDAYYVRHEKIPSGLYKTKITLVLRKMIKDDHNPENILNALISMCEKNFKSCSFVYRVYSMTHKYYDTTDNDTTDNDTTDNDTTDNDTTDNDTTNTNVATM